MSRRPARALAVAAAAVAAAAVAALFVTACSGAAKSVNADATVTECKPSADGDKPHASGQIANRSSKASNFLITVTFYDTSGNKVADAVDTVTNVEAANLAPWNATPAVDAKGPLTCKVTVRRTVAPGG